MPRKDYKDNIIFCPTEHMKADGFTKNSVSKAIRDNIFWHNPDMVNPRKLKKDAEEDDDVEEVTEFGSYLALNYHVMLDFAMLVSPKL